jgi:hypothetical protein
MNEVYKYYPKSEYLIYLETDKKKIQNELNSKSVTNWAQGPIGNSGYYKLVHCSPRKNSSKQLIIICKTEDTL